MNIYVASSWKNDEQPRAVRFLRALSHQVYDFRQDGFGWTQVDEHWQAWTPDEARDALRHPAAIHGFWKDKAALDRCDVCVCVLPCGRSSHLELGYAIGRGKIGIIFWPEDVHPYDPDLMYGLAQYFVVSYGELGAAIQRIEELIP